MLQSNKSNILAVAIGYVYEIHSVINSGVPNEHQQHRYKTTAVPSHAVPQADNAKRLYVAEGGRITEPGTFGTDPLKDRPDLVQRRNGVFHARNPSFDNIFGNVVSTNGQFFVDAIIIFFDLTRHFQTFLLYIISCTTIR